MVARLSHKEKAKTSETVNTNSVFLEGIAEGSLQMK